MKYKMDAATQKRTAVHVPCEEMCGSSVIRIGSDNQFVYVGLVCPDDSMVGREILIKPADLGTGVVWAQEEKEWIPLSVSRIHCYLTPWYSSKNMSTPDGERYRRTTEREQAQAEKNALLQRLSELDATIAIRR